MPTLLGLPVELQVATIDCIDLPSDLLSLACTCRVLHSLCIPEPLNYRVAAEPPLPHQSRTELWGLLVDGGRLARMVRAIDVRIRVDLMRYMVQTSICRPDGLLSDGPHCAVFALQHVAPATTGLTRVRLHLPMNSGHHAEDVEKFWEAVREACKCLREVDVRSPVTLTNSFFALEGLRVAKIHAEFDMRSIRGAGRVAVGLAALLARNPRLEVLHLTFVTAVGWTGYNPVELDGILGCQANLFTLRELALSGAIIWDDAHASAFFLRHPTIVSLDLDARYAPFLCRCDLPVGALPKLTSLSLTGSRAAFLGTIASARSPLETIRFRGDVDDDTFERLITLLESQGTVREIQFTEGNTEAGLASARKLEGRFSHVRFAIG